MGLMHSNAVAAQHRASARRRLKAEAEAAGIDTSDRAAFREWRTERSKRLWSNAIEASKAAKAKKDEA